MGATTSTLARSASRSMSWTASGRRSSARKESSTAPPWSSASLFAEVQTAKRTSENLLNRYGNELNGIFTPNESSTDGMLLALQDIDKAGKIRLVGFDASKSLLAAMKAKQLDGVAVQNPMKMGYLGVKTMVAHLRNQPVEKRIDTGVTLVTPENMDEPAMKELTSPPVDKYLKGQ